MTYQETFKLAEEITNKVNGRITEITGGATITSVKQLLALEKQACNDLNISIKQYNGLQRFYSNN